MQKPLRSDTGHIIIKNYAYPLGLLLCFRSSEQAPPFSLWRLKKGAAKTAANKMTLPHTSPRDTLSTSSRPCTTYQTARACVYEYEGHTGTPLLSIPRTLKPSFQKLPR